MSELNQYGDREWQNGVSIASSEQQNLADGS
jgi:hypothetical protein